MHQVTFSYELTLQTRCVICCKFYRDGENKLVPFCQTNPLLDNNDNNHIVQTLYGNALICNKTNTLILNYFNSALFLVINQNIKITQLSGLY